MILNEFENSLDTKAAARDILYRDTYGIWPDCRVPKWVFQVGNFLHVGTVEYRTICFWAIKFIVDLIKEKENAKKE